MVLCNASVAEHFSKLLQRVDPGRTPTKYTPSSTAAGQICLRIKGDSSKEIRGFIASMETLVSETLRTPSSPEQTALLRQWLEYCICVINFADTQAEALQDFNTILACRSFLVGHTASVADHIFYYVLYPVMAQMSMQDKERLCHVSRWFATVQHVSALRDPQCHKLLTFSKTPLYS